MCAVMRLATGIFFVALPALVFAQTERREASWTKAVNEHIRGLPRLDTQVGAPIHTGSTIKGEMVFDSLTVFNDDAHFLWPGAILDAQALSKGAIKPIALGRLPVRMSISGLYASSAPERSDAPVQPVFSLEVSDPSYATMSDGLQSVLAAGPLDPPACKTSINVKEFHSIDEALFGIGVSASFVVASIKGRLETERHRESNNVMAMLVQSYFTVHADHPPDPASFFATSVKADDLKNTIVGYQPVYVSQVEYGRILFFVASSRASRELFRSSVGAGFNLGIFGGSTDLSIEKKKLLEEAEIRAVALGGSGAAIADLLGKEKVPGIQSFMRSGQSFAAAVPIRYVLRYVGSGEIASVKLPYEYTMPPSQDDVEAIEIRFYTETNNKEAQDDVVVSLRRGNEEIGNATVGQGQEWKDQTGPHSLTVPVFRLVRTSEISKLSLVVEKNGDDDDWRFLYEVFVHLRDGRRMLVRKHRDIVNVLKLGDDDNSRSVTIDGLRFP